MEHILGQTPVNCVTLKHKCLKSKGIRNEEKWDFVLVSDIHEMGSEKEIKRKKFLDELSKKGFTIKVRGCRRKRQQILGLAWAPASQEMGEA